MLSPQKVSQPGNGSLSRSCPPCLAEMSTFAPPFAAARLEILPLIGTSLCQPLAQVRLQALAVKVGACSPAKLATPPRTESLLQSSLRKALSEPHSLLQF